VSIAPSAPDVTDRGAARVVVDEAYRRAADFATIPPPGPSRVLADEPHGVLATRGADPGNPNDGVVPPTSGSGQPIDASRNAAVGWATASAISIPREPRALRGARAIEVAAMLGDTVIDVKHCIDPGGGKITLGTWAIFAGGVACLVAAALAFTLSVRDAADNKARLDTWTRVEHKPAWAFRPAQLGAGGDWIALGGLALGLAGVSFGISRIRRDKPSPYYRIGTAPGVELAIQGTPAAAFPLVAPSGDDFVFNFGPGIDGELILDGTSIALSELAAAGRSRPSAAVAGAIEVPIPLHARIRARAGHVTFVVSAVAPPRRHVASLLGRAGGRVLAYVAGSLVAHAVVLAILFAIPPEPSTINLDQGTLEPTGIPAHITAREDPRLDTAGGQGVTGTRTGEVPAMALPSGEAGVPQAKSDGRRQIARTRDEPRQVTRDERLAVTRREGILGSDVWHDGIKLASATSDYASGFDETNIDGSLLGDGGGGRGSFGAGLSGFSSGGCVADRCDTIAIGTGGYDTGGTIGTDRYSSYGPGLRRSGGTGWRPHPQTLPQVGEPQIPGSYDKKIVRRYIRHHLNEIAYCYDKQLLAHPGIGGEITVSFFIAPGGHVLSAKGAGFDREVASCLSDVIGNIAFPPPGDGGVQVNYPFTFHTTGP
jgi:hypothetical protein